MRASLAKRSEEKTWYFIFNDSGHNAFIPFWAQCVIKPGDFKHVFCCSQMDNNVIVLDSLASHIECNLYGHPSSRYLPLPVDTFVLNYWLDGYSVVKITYPVTKEPNLHDCTNFYPGCVTFCKGVLGISDWIFTPQHFYEWLLDNGGELLRIEYFDIICKEQYNCTPEQFLENEGIDECPHYLEAARKEMTLLPRSD